MALTKREEIYDAEISPLMSKIIAVCKEHDIPMVFSAQLNDDRDGDSDVDEDGESLGEFYCTTFILPKNSGKRLNNAYPILKPNQKPWWSAVSVQRNPDGSETFTQVAGSDMDDERDA